MASTLAHPMYYRIARRIEAVVPSAVLSGIVGDEAHTRRPGKHLSFNVNKEKWPGSWPVVDSRDKNASGDQKKYSVAIDITMSRKDQDRVHRRMQQVFRDRAFDPRAKFLHGVNGWDGEGSPGRYNFVTGEVSITDDSHKWHEHVEGFAVHVGNQAAEDAIVSIFADETLAEYLGEDVALDAADKEWLKANLGPNAVWEHRYGPEWQTMEVGIANLLQQVSGKIGNNPGNTNNFSDWRMTQDTVQIKTDLATLKANLAQLAGRDFVDEDAIATAVLENIATRDISEAAEALKAVFTDEQIAALKAAL